MANFKEGDVVVLKSGGPEMTVESVEGNHPDWFKTTYYNATCVWYEGREIRRETFKESLLKKPR